jgi:hypothetical protein
MAQGHPVSYLSWGVVGDRPTILDSLLVTNLAYRSSLEQLDVLADLRAAGGEEVVPQVPPVDEADPSLTRVEQLEAALQSSRTIGAAIGMVMATRRVGYDQALDMLKAHSNRTNVKMHALCDEMVHQGKDRGY